MKNQINALIGGNESYAYAFLTRERGYGHFCVNIRLEVPEYGSRHSGMVKITGQIGSGDFPSSIQDGNIYAFRVSYGGSGDSVELPELEAATKIMKKMQRALDEQFPLCGKADSFADYCQRALVASGVKRLIVELDGGWANSGLMTDKILVGVGASSRKRLKEMEGELIGAFARKAA